MESLQPLIISFKLTIDQQTLSISKLNKSFVDLVLKFLYGSIPNGFVSVLQLPYTHFPLQDTFSGPLLCELVIVERKEVRI